MIEWEFDALRRPLTETWYTDSSKTTSVHTIEMEYDLLGRLVSAIDAVAGYRYTRDGPGLVTREEQFLPGEPLRGDPFLILDADYDRLGRRSELSASLDLGKGLVPDFVNEYGYDRLGRMTSIVQFGIDAKDALPVADKAVEFTYNPAGQIAQIDRYTDLETRDGRRRALRLIQG